MDAYGWRSGTVVISLTDEQHEAAGLDPDLELAARCEVRWTPAWPGCGGPDPQPPDPAEVDLVSAEVIEPEDWPAGVDLPVVTPRRLDDLELTQDQYEQALEQLEEAGDD